MQFQNLANTKWRSAEHVFESRTPNELAAGLPGQNGSNYTPGNPFNVKSGDDDSHVVSIDRCMKAKISAMLLIQ
jgi:hypothetical protein